MVLLSFHIVCKGTKQIVDSSLKYYPRIGQYYDCSLYIVILSYSNSDSIRYYS